MCGDFSDLKMFIFVSDIDTILLSSFV